MKVFPLVFWSVAGLLATPAGATDPHPVTSHLTASPRSTSSELNDVRSNPLLRTGDSGNDDDEERMLPLLASLEGFWWKLFFHSNRNEDIEKVLYHKRFKTFIHRKITKNGSNYYREAISMLTSYSNSKTVQSRLMKASISNGIHHEVFDFLVEYWLKYSTPYDVLKFLRDQQNSKRLLAKNLLQMWTRYVTKYNLEFKNLLNPSMEVIRLYGEKNWMAILAEAKQDRLVKPEAEELEKLLIDALLVEKTHPRQFSSYLSFDQKPLESPEYQTLMDYTARYVAMFKENGKENGVKAADVYLFSALQQHFNDEKLANILHDAIQAKIQHDKALAKILHDAKATSTTAEAAKIMHDEEDISRIAKAAKIFQQLQFNYWSTSVEKKTPAAVHELLMLSYPENPLVDYWFQYCKYYASTSKDHTAKKATLLALRKHFSDNDLKTMLSTDTEPVAKDLLDGLAEMKAAIFAT